MDSSSDAPKRLKSFARASVGCKMLMNFLFTYCVLPSPGCILAELYTGYPLFPGENEVEQLACIMELMGAPSDDLINQATRRRLFFGELPAVSLL